MGDPNLGRGLPFTAKFQAMYKRLRSLERQNAAVTALATAAKTRRHVVYTYAGVDSFSPTVMSRDQVITWPMPLADVDYTTVCDVLPPAGSAAVLTWHVSSKTTTGCVVTLYAGGATVPAGAVLTVDALHL